MCSFVTEKELVQAIKKKGAKKLEDIQLLTSAATRCGKCIPQIDQILKDNPTPPTSSDQLKLDF
jgi:NAD(P)H-nitrite reductase large subunit